MALDWNDGALADGLRCYRNQEFFDAHEHWEGVWRASTDPQKTFLQGLIQIAAAFHHLHRQNARGAASLLRSALRRLEMYPDPFEGIAVESVRASIRAWLTALPQSDTPPNLPFPEL